VLRAQFQVSGAVAAKGRGGWQAEQGSGDHETRHCEQSLPRRCAGRLAWTCEEIGALWQQSGSAGCRLDRAVRYGVPPQPARETIGFL